ncbi:sensor histidine kinase [Pseudohalioglobus lutimaris]|uniref:histidine kinase n=1 Tax=Pseudohalioglobus lutimaris TaxID=1737061 RepID=A0A2N5X1D7_9GAMM|nr:ATP-binding protein [Pseudohalioglobus lutimaris]PLW68292.1 PAS domain-containing sensor histidine kinase [Pseudohalioglobus lutimaris]
MGQADTLSVEELEKAFAVFNRVSSELDSTYRELESRVSSLTDELARTRSARVKDLAEKERLANRLSALVAALPGGVLILDRNLCVADANPEAFELLGAPLIGESWEGVISRVTDGNAALSSEILSSDGRFFSIVSRKLDDRGDKVVLITDVTELHNLQEQLGRKKRLTALGEMATRLAHQIRTPLSSTALYLSQLGRADIAADERRAIADKVVDRLSHMEALVESMLSFVRGSTPTSERILLNSVLTEFESTVLPQLAVQGSSVRVQPVDDSLVLCGARDELVGSLCNLAMNAQEAAGGAVNITVWVGALDHNRMQLKFRDDGPGIDPDIMDRVFDPFFTTRSKGTGLGLAVVARTIANHDGEITVSNHPQGGAEFSITLPIAGAEEQIKGIEQEALRA